MNEDSRDNGVLSGALALVGAGALIGGAYKLGKKKGMQGLIKNTQQKASGGTKELKEVVDNASSQLQTDTALITLQLNPEYSNKIQVPVNTLDDIEQDITSNIIKTMHDIKDMSAAHELNKISQKPNTPAYGPTKNAAKELNTNTPKSETVVDTQPNTQTPKVEIKQTPNAEVKQETKIETPQENIRQNARPVPADDDFNHIGGGNILPKLDEDYMTKKANEQRLLAQEREDRENVINSMTEFINDFDASMQYFNDEGKKVYKNKVNQLIFGKNKDNYDVEEIARNIQHHMDNNTPEFNALISSNPFYNDSLHSAVKDATNVAIESQTKSTFVNFMNEFDKRYNSLGQKRQESFVNSVNESIFGGNPLNYDVRDVMKNINNFSQDSQEFDAIANVFYTNGTDFSSILDKASSTGKRKNNKKKKKKNK